STTLSSSRRSALDARTTVHVALPFRNLQWPQLLQSLTGLASLSWYQRSRVPSGSATIPCFGFALRSHVGSQPGATLLDRADLADVGGRAAYISAEAPLSGGCRRRVSRSKSSARRALRVDSSIDSWRQPGRDGCARRRGSRGQG